MVDLSIVYVNRHTHGWSSIQSCQTLWHHWPSFMSVLSFVTVVVIHYHHHSLTPSIFHRSWHPSFTSGILHPSFIHGWMDGQALVTHHSLTGTCALPSILVGCASVLITYSSRLMVLSGSWARYKYFMVSAKKKDSIRSSTHWEGSLTEVKGGERKRKEEEEEEEEEERGGKRRSWYRVLIGCVNRLYFIFWSIDNI